LWREFDRQDADQILAPDFFAVEMPLIGD